MRRTPAGRRQRGFALLIVLWALVLIAFLIARLSAAASGEARIAFNLRSNAIEQARADGAVHEAAFRLLDQGARHWAADGAPHRLDLPGGTVEVRMTDEAGKVNLNAAPVELLRALLVVVGADPRLAAAVAPAIVDWRDEGDQAGEATDAAAYRAAGLDYGPPHAPFRSVDELGRVLGMTPGLLAALRPHLTVFSTYGPSRATRDPVVVRAVQAMREAGAAPPNDQAYEPVDVVSVRAVATGADGGRAEREAVLRLDPRSQDGGMRILAWQ